MSKLVVCMYFKHILIKQTILSCSYGACVVHMLYIYVYIYVCILYTVYVYISDVR